uniref:Uncharacterized protein n=1 Tax=Rhizophora mucronata TaxID=61149 RepID=A0A2P2R0Q2_RHIMU
MPLQAKRNDQPQIPRTVENILSHMNSTSQHILSRYQESLVCM